MEVTVNHQSYIIPEDCSVSLLLRDVLQQQAQGLAVAIADAIVPKAEWEQHVLRSGDQIIIIKATQGG